MNLSRSYQYSVVSNQKWLLISMVILLQFMMSQETWSASSLIQIPSDNRLLMTDYFFAKHGEGWHWYQDSDQCSECNDQKKNKKEPPENPSEAIEEQRKELKTKLHAAIVEPTQENITSYILAQKVLMDQSQKFSEAWQRVVMTNPFLDETLQHPVNQGARHVYYDELQKEKTKLIRELSQSYGLFFFFKKDCAYCHGFAPIVKHFADQYGWSVLAVSLDGGKLKEFPRARQNNGIAERLNVSHVPALIALHPESGKLIPLAYGMVSQSEIERRVEFLSQLQIGEVK